MDNTFRLTVTYATGVVQYHTFPTWLSRALMVIALQDQPVTCSVLEDRPVVS
jgi:hypothetical protein